MATVEEIRDQLTVQVNEVKDALTAAIDRVAADVETLKAGAAADIPPETFDPVTTGLAGIKDSLDTLDPIPDAVTEAPAETPPAEEPPPAA